MYIIVAFGFQYTISLEIIIMYQLEIHNNNQHPSGEKKGESFTKLITTSIT